MAGGLFGDMLGGLTGADIIGHGAAPTAEQLRIMAGISESVRYTLCTNFWQKYNLVLLRQRKSLLRERKGNPIAPQASITSSVSEEEPHSGTSDLITDNELKRDQKVRVFILFGFESSNLYRSCFLETGPKPSAKTSTRKKG